MVGISTSAYTVNGLVGGDVLDFSRLLPGMAASDVGQWITQSRSGANLRLSVAGSAGTSQITLVG